MRIATRLALGSLTVLLGIAGSSPSVAGRDVHIVQSQTLYDALLKTNYRPPAAVQTARQRLASVRNGEGPQPRLVFLGLLGLSAFQLYRRQLALSRTLPVLARQDRGAS